MGCGIKLNIPKIYQNILVENGVTINYKWSKEERERVYLILVFSKRTTSLRLSGIMVLACPP